MIQLEDAELGGASFIITLPTRWNGECGEATAPAHGI
jgi:hypothetical protein